MLSDNYKKPNTDEKKAFYYFGFERLAPFKDVKEVIDQARESADEKTLEKIDEHVEHIKTYFDTPELKEQDSLHVPFKKDKRRAKWKSLKKDLPELKEFIEEKVSQKVAEIEMEIEEAASEGEVEPVIEEDVVEEGEVEPVVEEEAIEPVVEEELVGDGEIEAADEETEIEPVVDEGEIEVVDEETEIEPVVEETIPPVEEDKGKHTKIYINGELLGYCADPVTFTQEMREKRRKAKYLMR